MKTSNKILLFIGIALLISPFINAYSLKQKFDNKEYTLLNLQNKNESEFLAISPTDSIHIIGGNNLSVEIIKGDSTSVEKEKNSNVYIYEEKGVLIIQYSKENNAMDSNPSGLVTIKIPTLTAISFEGKLIVDSTGNKNNYSITRYYSPFGITIKDFKTDHLNIQGLNGGGSIELVNNEIKDLFLNIGELSSFKANNTNHFDLLKVQTSENPSITLDGTYIKSMKTNLDANTSLTLKGTNIESMSSYK